MWDLDSYTKGRRGMDAGTKILRGKVTKAEVGHTRTSSYEVKKARVDL